MQNALAALVQPSVQKSFVEPVMQNRLQQLARMQQQAPQGNALGQMMPQGAMPPQGQRGAGNQPANYQPQNDIAAGLIDTAAALGVDPIDLATIVSYETAGTFDPTKRGPTTQWGQHRGLIQFGEPQAREYGVDWDNPLSSQIGENGAIARYFRKNGAQPGMGILDLYSIVNAGGPGLYNRSDANNGGAPGTVRDKVENQMADHRRNALRLLGVQ